MGVAHQYAMSLVHAVLQVFAASSGVVTPSLPGECLIFSLSVMFGAFMLALLTASLVTKYSSEAHASERAYKSRMDMLDQWMRHSRLHVDLRRKIRLHLKSPMKVGISTDLNSRNFP